MTMTASGMRLMEAQETTLKNYYGRVIERFGEDKLIALFDLMKELEHVMSLELNEGGEATDGSINDRINEIG